MELDRRICDRARRSRDARFDGRFFIGVTSTGIYCRPICPARSPKDENIRYFPTAAAAEAAGLRPCLRCRPEASPGTPAWFGTSGVVSRGLRLIGEGALDIDGVDRLADRLGVTARHLRRLFLQHLGATPLQVALTRRVHFAKKLLDETSLPFNQVAFASGFGSLRRFNSQIKRTYTRTPSQLRRLARQKIDADPECYRFRLAYRPPYDWDAVLAFLAARATPGVEVVSAAAYRRTITVDGHGGSIGVSHATTGPALDLEVRCPTPRSLLLIVERVRRMFDLGADPAVIAAHLGGDRCCAVRCSGIPAFAPPVPGTVSNCRSAPFSGSRSPSAARRPSPDAWPPCSARQSPQVRDWIGSSRRRPSSPARRSRPPVSSPLGPARFAGWRGA